MTIKVARPPNYEEICAAFPFVRTKKFLVFTYGDMLYNPGARPIAHHLVVHEMVHAGQQLEMGIDEWWARYCEDAKFRLTQEVDAYRAQYLSMNRKERRALLVSIARDLSGPIYNNLVEYETAMELITGK